MSAQEQYAKAKRGESKSQSKIYSYSIDTNSYAEMWYKMHHDLGYPLKVDSRYKRAIVYNKSGLEKQIEDMITKVIGEHLKELGDLVVNDIIAQLNNLTTSSNGLLVRKNGVNTSNFGAMIGKVLGKSLAKGFNDILNSINNNNDRNRKR